MPAQSVANIEAIIAVHEGTAHVGGLMHGSDGLYVGTGLARHSENFEQELIGLLGDYGTTARWAMPALRW